MTTVAYFPLSQSLFQNQVFDARHPQNQNGALERWIHARRHLATKGIDLVTIDMVHPREVDAWLLEEPTPRRLASGLRRGMRPRRTAIMLIEPPVINPVTWKLMPKFRRVFKAVLTWHSDWADHGGPFMRYHLPVEFDEGRCRPLRDTPKENLCLMMHSNKTSSDPKELYSLRRKIIRDFDAQGTGLLDLYGYGWNLESAPDAFITDSYAGTTGDKWATYAKYHFSICVDNSIEPGYISYDPLISMGVGTVPVYLPMPDSTQYIPPDTFIDYTRFDDTADLIPFLKDLAGTEEYEAYRRRGWDFVTSDAFHPFTLDRFARDIEAAIRRVLPQEKRVAS